MASMADVAQVREDTTTNARILIVDADPANVQVAQRLLQRAGHQQVHSTTIAAEALPIFIAWRPDLVLLALHMPRPGGFEILAELQEHTPPCEFVPVVVYTTDATTETRQRALALGARDFLSKPFDAIEFRLRIENLLRMRMLYQKVRHQNEVLEARVRERTREVEMAHLDTLRRLARAAEYRDDDTGEHTLRVGATASALAAVLGLPIGRAEMIRQAAPLHDIGKIGIPDAILLKPGKLNADEQTLIRAHAAGGARLVSESHWPLMQLAEQIAHSHHEHWDGTGYPQGLSREDIPLEARITTLADVFDALTHARPYKPAWSVEHTLDFIREQRGRYFDPDVVDAFLEVAVQTTIVEPAGGATPPANDKSNGLPVPRASGRDVT
jgi:putative two-component system response regulator